VSRHSTCRRESTRAREEKRERDGEERERVASIALRHLMICFTKCMSTRFRTIPIFAPYCIVSAVLSTLTHLVPRIICSVQKVFSDPTVSSRMASNSSPSTGCKVKRKYQKQYSHNCMYYSICSSRWWHHHQQYHQQRPLS